MELLIASYNEHKIKELQPLFPEHRLQSPHDIGLGAMEIEETGASYFENALIKATALFSLTGRPTLADDSGLSVTALLGAPGIRSSRYGSKEGNATLPSEERNALLLTEMLGRTDRTCAFFCCLVLVYGKDRFISVQETCPGILLSAPQGKGGFGYDPIVFLPTLGKSMAELTAEEKNLVSHRGRASRAMNKIITRVDLGKDWAF